MENLTNIQHIMQDISDLKVEVSQKVSQSECEDRRNALRMEYDVAQREISKIIGLSRVHSEQIEQLKSSQKWQMGIVSGVIVSLILMIVKGALGI